MTPHCVVETISELSRVETSIKDSKFDPPDGFPITADLLLRPPKSATFEIFQSPQDLDPSGVASRAIYAGKGADHSFTIASFISSSITPGGDDTTGRETEGEKVDLTQSVADLDHLHTDQEEERGVGASTMASASSARPLSTSSSTYSDLAQLTLLPYLSASPIPTLILRTEPLLAALLTRESFRSRSRSPEPTLPRRGSGDTTGTTRAERTASVTSVGTGGSWGASIARGTLPATAHEESQAIRDGLGPLIGSLQPEWCNEAWVELGNSRIAKQAQGSVNLTRGTLGRGKAGRIAEDTNLEDVVMGESAHGTTSRGGSVTSTTSTLGSSSNKLRFLDATQQTILLSLLLDLLEAPLDPPRFSPGGSVPPPPPTSVTLGSISMSATLLPSRTHFILSSTNIGSTHVTPPLSMAVSRTASPFLRPTRAVSPSIKSSTFSNSTRPTTNPLFFPSQLPPSPPCLDPYLEYLLATGTEMGRLIVDHPWHTSQLAARRVEFLALKLTILQSVILQRLWDQSQRGGLN